MIKNLYRPSHLHTFLKEVGSHAKKSLSQNFLIDGNIIQKIVNTANISSSDFVVEIGPGPGALTQALLSRNAKVLAIEMDPLFAKELSRLQTPDIKLEIIQADILQCSLTEILQERGIKKCKVVANLPYHITTPILTQLFPLHQKISSLTLMVQKEFAERMSAQKGTAEYSSLSVFLAFYGAVISSFPVKPTCFYPKPTVMSSVVHCTLHPPLLEGKERDFFQLTRTAFGKRRKMLRSSLKEIYTPEKIDKAFASLGYQGTERPEELSISEFLSLYAALSCKNSTK